MPSKLSADIAGKIPRTLLFKLIELENGQGTSEQNITGLEENIVEIQSDVSVLQTNVTTLQAAVSTLQGNVSNLQSDVADLQEAVAALIYSTDLSMTISAGVITITDTGAQEYRITLTSESGTTGQLNQINGLSAGGKVVLYAASGHTITISNGVYLKLQADFTLDGYNSITLRSWGGSIHAEEARTDIYDIEDEWGALPDWLAAVSLGFYCDPASTMAERAMLFASHGLIKSLG